MQYIQIYKKAAVSQIIKINTPLLIIRPFGNYTLHFFYKYITSS